MSMVDAVQALLADWHRRRSETLAPLRPIDFAAHVVQRAAHGFEPAVRLLRSEGLPAGDARPRPIGSRVGAGGPDADLLEYAEDMLERQWEQDRDVADTATEIESYWEAQNRLRRLLGLTELTKDELRGVLQELE